jgi:urease accessory protein UreE
MFRSLPIVERVYRVQDLPSAAAGYARDSITLGWEERLAVRGRRRSDGGVEFGTTLPRGTILATDDCFIVEPARVVVRVVERAESVFVITPKTTPEWALFAYRIGNGHQPLMIAGDALILPSEPGVEDLLTAFEIPFVRADRPFTPVTSAFGH